MIVSAERVLDSSNQVTRKWRVMTDGGIVVRIDPESVSSMTAAAKETGESKQTIRAAISRAAGVDEPPKPFTVFAGQREFSDVDPLLALDEACRASSPDTFLRWEGTLAVCAADIDVKHGTTFAEHGLTDLAAATACERAWVTQSGGLRLVFTAHDDITAAERAAAAVLLSDVARDPRVHRVEFLPRTRPPAGYAHVGAGTLGHTIAWAEGKAAATVEQHQIDGYLARRGLQIGQRVPHTYCPVNPGETSSARDPVMVNEAGLYCFRCDGTEGEGFRSYAYLIEGVKHEPHPLCESARRRVHWAHMAAVMRVEWPESFPWHFAEWAYKGLCKALGCDDQALDLVFDSDFHWLRGEGGAWLHSQSLQPEGIERALPTLSWTRGKPALVASAANTGILKGYRPVRPVSVVLRPDALNGVVPLQKPRKIPIQLDREDALPWDEAFTVLARDFVGISEVYLKSLLVACVCAEAGARPVGLLVTGTSGSAKSTTTHVAAGLLGATVGTARISAPAEDWRRMIGQALASGMRPILVNEIDKVAGLRAHSPKLLDLAHPHQYRPLYGADVLTPFRAPLVLTGITIPQMFLDSPELGRRYRLLDLRSRVRQEWDALDPLHWREGRSEREISLDIESDRPRVADSLVMWAVDFARGHSHKWESAARALGLPEAHRADDEAHEIREEALRALFDHVCGRGAPRRYSDSSQFPADRGWVELTEVPAVREILMPDVVGPNVDPRYICGRDLAATDWAGLLDVPELRFESRIRGGCWVGRFVQGGRKSPVRNEMIVLGHPS